MKTFTIAFITSRSENHWEWWRDSFLREADRFGLVQEPDLIIVDALYTGAENHSATKANNTLTVPLTKSPRQLHIPPKPTIWQGKYRVLPENWWAASNARNTALCLCQTEWICFFDDRCVIAPGYLDALQAAMDGNYIMLGAYEKWERMQVENGAIVKTGFNLAVDGRSAYCNDNKLPNPMPCGGDWLFGANFAAPLEWLLEVGGLSEICDGLGFEDVQLGLVLQHNGRPFKHDQRAKVIQDRSEGRCGPVMRHEDKGRGTGPVTDEKAHKLLAMFKPQESKKSIHIPEWPFDIRQVRRDILAGNRWPTPPAVEFKDWYDGQPIKEFT